MNLEMQKWVFKLLMPAEKDQLNLFVLESFEILCRRVELSSSRARTLSRPGSRDADAGLRARSARPARRHAERAPRRAGRLGPGLPARAQVRHAAARRRPRRLFPTLDGHVPTHDARNACRRARHVPRRGLLSAAARQPGELGPPRGPITTGVATDAERLTKAGACGQVLGDLFHLRLGWQGAVRERGIIELARASSDAAE